MKKAVWGLIIIGLLGSLYAIYLFFKAPEDTRDQPADFSIDASSLASEFDADENLATLKYTDKIIEVTGKVMEVKADEANPTITLDTGNPLTSITCSFYPEDVPKLNNISPGDEVTIKGKCTGKLMDVILNYCIIKTN